MIRVLTVDDGYCPILKCYYQFGSHKFGHWHPVPVANRNVLPGNIRDAIRSEVKTYESLVKGLFKGKR